MELLEEHLIFGGWQQRWRHDSVVLNCPMTFSIFIPPSRGMAPELFILLISQVRGPEIIGLRT